MQHYTGVGYSHEPNESLLSAYSMRGQYWFWALCKMPAMTAEELPTPHAPLGHTDLGIRAETGKQVTQESEDMESTPASGGCPSLAPSVSSRGRPERGEGGQGGQDGMRDLGEAGIGGGPGRPGRDGGPRGGQDGTGGPGKAGMGWGAWGGQDGMRDPWGDQDRVGCSQGGPGQGGGPKGRPG